MVWAGTLLCLGWFVHGWQIVVPGLADRTGGIKGADYIQFYVMGSEIDEGRPDRLYDTPSISEQARRRISPVLEYHPERNPYGPQVALAFSPLARLPFLASLAVFAALSVAAYAAAAWLLWKHAPGLAGDGWYVALVAAGCPALLVTLRFGQISAMTLLAPALALAALAAERRVLTGMALGLLVYKPQLLVVAVPMLLFARDWRGLGGLLAATVVQFAVTWPAVGSYAMRQYLATLTELTTRPDVVMLYPENSHSLRGFLRLLGLPPAAATIIVVVLVFACTPALARVWRSQASPLMRMSMLVLLTLLLTPHLLTYDLLLLAVPIVALAEWTVQHADDRYAMPAIVLAIALYLAPFSPVLAAHTHLQMSTIAIAAAAWLMWRELSEGSEMIAR